MRILVDALIVKREQAGLRSVALNITRALAALPDADVLVIVGQDEGGEWGDAEVYRVPVGANGPLRRWVWRRQNRRRLAHKIGADVIFTLSPEYSKTPGLPNIVMVHDIGPLLAPGIYGRVRFLRYLATLSRTVRRADAVITVSASTRLDLVRWCGLAIADKTTAVPIAGQKLVSGAVRPSGLPQGVGDFVLYVGAHLAHKNVSTVLRAFERGLVSDSTRLVCVGPDYGGERAAELAPYQNSEWLIDLGFVPVEQLAWLNAHAKQVVFPSLFEGFGMPVVEAVEAGGRVVATRLGVLEELLGGGIHYVSDPLSPESWGLALSTNHGSPAPFTPSPRLFSWEAVAEEAFDVLHKTADRS